MADVPTNRKWRRRTSWAAPAHAAVDEGQVSVVGARTLVARWRRRARACLRLLRRPASRAARRGALRPAARHAPRRARRRPRPPLTWPQRPLWRGAGCRPRARVAMHASSGSRTPPWPSSGGCSWPSNGQSPAVCSRRCSRSKRSRPTLRACGRRRSARRTSAARPC